MPKQQKITWIVIDKVEKKLLFYYTLREIQEKSKLTSFDVSNLRRKERLKKKSYSNTTLGKLSQRYRILKRGDMSMEEFNKLITYFN